MLVPGETYPYKPLTETDRQLIVASCGGEPVTNTQNLRDFLKISGYALIADGFMPSFMNAMSWRSVNSLDIPTADAARAYNRGVLFYAGVLSMVSQTRKVQFDNDVVLRIREGDSQNFAIESIQTIQEQVPSYCDLTESVRPAMETQDDQLHQVSLVGAGAMHILVTESLERVAGSTADDILFAHPELADLTDFDDFKP